MECSIVESRNCERFAKESVRVREREREREREICVERESVRCGDESGDWGGDKRVATLGDMQKIKRWLLIWPLVMEPCPLDFLGETPSPTPPAPTIPGPPIAPVHLLPKRPAGVNQHTPVYRQGWMISD
jgi:hypothetical protein